MRNWMQWCAIAAALAVGYGAAVASESDSRSPSAARPLATADRPSRAPIVAEARSPQPEALASFAEDLEQALLERIEERLDALEARLAARARPRTRAATQVVDSGAGAEARRVVDAALARGRWTSEDLDGLREARLGMDPAEYFALQLELAGAINRQELDVETEGPPF